MHPLLTPINRYGYYLLAWTPLAGILVYLLAVPGNLGWLDATVLVIPLCLVYQFVCLSAWYILQGRAPSRSLSRSQPAYTLGRRRRHQPTLDRICKAAGLRPFANRSLSRIE